MLMKKFHIRISTKIEVISIKENLFLLEIL